MKTHRNLPHVATTVCRRHLIGVAVGASLLGCSSGTESDAAAGDSQLEASNYAEGYHLPFLSGDRRLATTYPDHGDGATDWNLLGDGDCGEPILAMATGVVEDVVSTCDRCTDGPGNQVRVDHDGEGYDSLYFHLETVYVRKGDPVERGATLGTVGRNGRSTGCHIHAEVRTDGGELVVPKYRWFEDGTKKRGFIEYGREYESYNHGPITAARARNGGAQALGFPTEVTASRVAWDGIAKYYDDTVWGDAAIYYQSSGCRGLGGDEADFCEGYNNSTRAFLVRSGFYGWYFACGGPSCWIGFPTGDEVETATGSTQTFEFGFLEWSRDTGEIVARPYEFGGGGPPEDESPLPPEGDCSGGASLRAGLAEPIGWEVWAWHDARAWKSSVSAPLCVDAPLAAGTVVDLNARHVDGRWLDPAPGTTAIQAGFDELLLEGADALRGRCLTASDVDGTNLECWTSEPPEEEPAPTGPCPPGTGLAVGHTDPAVILHAWHHGDHWQSAVGQPLCITTAFVPNVVIDVSWVMPPSAWMDATPGQTAADLGFGSLVLNGVERVASAHAVADAYGTNVHLLP